MHFITRINNVLGICVYLYTVGINGAPPAGLEHPSYEHLQALYTSLTTGYDQRIRPRKNLSESVEVSMSFTIESVTDFDVAGQTLRFMGYFDFFWTDELIVWEPKDYGNLRGISFPIEHIWSPIFLYTIAYDGRGEIYNTRDVVTYTFEGSASWSAEGMYNVICDVNIKYYPFDKQTCNMRVYVDSSTRNSIDLIALRNTGSMEDYTLNSEWKLLNVTLEKQDSKSLAIIMISLELERRTEFIFYTVVAPLILLSILNIGVFIVPVNSGEKASIAVTIFLSYGVFSSIIISDLPHHSLNVSYLLLYLLTLLIISVVTVTYAYVESWLYSHLGDKPVGCNIFKSRNRVSGTEAALNEHQEKENGVLPGDKGLPRILKWKDLLRIMDIIVFGAGLIAGIVLTSVFLNALSKRQW